ncbi:MAG TPA: cysteine methyltransferase [bacterium]|nr:cysteine methyltransferase [bacterium]
MSFFKEVYRVVKKIPKGKVLSYGQVAAMLGNPRAARQVGWALNGLQKSEKGMTETPWWRVVNKVGYLSIRGDDPTVKFLQRELLEKEGIKVSEEMVVDMDVYGWRQ